MKFIKLYLPFFYNGLIICLSVLQTIMITNYCDQKTYGYYGYYISLSQFVLIATQWGFTSWGVNQLTKLDNFGLSSLLNKIIVAKSIIGSIAFISLIIYLIMDHDQMDVLVAVAFFLYYLSWVASLEILYISQSKVEKMVRITFLSKILYTIILGCVLLFRVTPQCLFMLFAIQSIMNSLFLYIGQNSFKIKYINFQIRVGEVIQNASSNFVLVFFSFLFASGPVIFSGHILGKENFAVVYASTAVIKMVQASYQPMIYKILPKLNKGLSMVDDIKSALLFSLISTSVIYFMAPLIVKYIFSDHYVGLLPAIRLYAFSITPGILSTIFVSQWAVFADKIKLFYFSIFIITIIMFVILNNYTSGAWQLTIETMLIGEWGLFVSAIIIKLVADKVLVRENITTSILD
jgi:O-antigen/teichoic acid export membrane protein